MDEIYDAVIAPTLSKLNIIPTRVDRIVHNSDINTKILDLINRADFGVIDLTYARPSVYYEAGYLEGQGKSVIYIVRDDHFRRKATDDNGNEIVHFDLSVRNIIPWSKLSTELIPRIHFVTESLYSVLQYEDEELDKIHEFELLRLHDRILTAKQYIIDYLLSYRFTKVSLGTFFIEVYESIGVRAFVYCDENLTQKDITDVTFEGIRFMRSDGYKGVCIGIFCSLTQIPRSRIERALRLFTRADETCYHYENDMAFFLHPVTSISKLGEMLEKSQIPISA